MSTIHVPVLLKEVEEEGKRAASKRLGEDLVYLDGTLGGAGHAKTIAEALRGRLTLIGIDKNPLAIEEATATLKGKVQKLILEVESFRNLDTVLRKHSIGKIDFILLDLGLSSDELEASGKGFSFQKDEPLLMTMGDPLTYPFTAKTIVNNWDEEVIADIIYGYSEDRFARRIARAIVLYREKKAIESTHELAEVVKGAVPAFARRSRIHPATKTFQALRIVVNDELASLKEGLEKGYDALRKGGIMAVISFHSLEDRIVKEFNKSKAQKDKAIVSKKAIKASKKEILHNPRARSAKLRILEKGN